MSNLHIIVYSATGNTRRALGIVAGQLATRGYTLMWHNLCGNAPELENIAREDLLLLGFPALGFSAPEPVIRALRAMPRMEGRRAAIICACGATLVRGKAVKGWAGTAVPEAARILASKGIEVHACAEVSYPENWRQVSSPAIGEARETLLRFGDEEALAFGSALARSLEKKDDTKIKIRRGPLTHILMPLIARLFRIFGRRGLARLFVADGDCTGCGVCARACPAQAIHMKAGRPTWTTACSACNRCINACPAGAIQTSNLRLAFIGILNIAAIFVSFPIAGILIATLENHLGPGLPRLAAGLLEIPLAFAPYTLFTFIQLGPFDAFLRFLESRGSLRKLFTSSFTKQYPQYIAPGFEVDRRNR